MAHARARLTPEGRAALVHRVLVQGWPITRAAEAMAVSRSTAHKWIRRFVEHGPVGLLDRPSRPLRCPRALAQGEVQRILTERQRTKHGPHRLAWSLGHPRSTVYGVLRRHGMNRVAWMDRPTGRVIRRYERERPGDLVHIDVKKLGRIPPGGGWRIRGRGPRTSADRRRRLGYDFIHTAVDDHSRLAYVEVHADERGPTAAAFLARAAQFFSGQGVLVRQVMTDNAFTYRLSAAFQGQLQEMRARHVLIPPRHPQVNGKVERFNRTLLEEWAYVRLYRSNEARLDALSSWITFYNSLRPHTALDGQPPASRL